jgi:hypothetical protein
MARYANYLLYESFLIGCAAGALAALTELARPVTAVRAA